MTPDDAAVRPRSGRQVRELLDRMTLEQKAGQLCTAMLTAEVPEWGPGLVLVPPPTTSSTAGRVQAFQSALSGRGAGIPALPVAVGPGPPFPGTLGGAATWDVVCAERSAADAARVLRAAGLYGALGHAGSTDAADPGRPPVALLADPVLGAVIAEAQVLGAQGREAGRTGRIAAGHVAFVATMGVGRDGSWHERTLRTRQLAAAETMVRAGAAIVVPSVAGNAGVPGHTDSWMLRDVLRDEWGFSGVVVAAAGGLASLVTQHKVVGSREEALASAVEAGVDVIGSGIEDVRRIVALVRTGALPEWLVDDAAGAVLLLKQRLDLLEHRASAGPPAPDPIRPRLLERAVTRSLVLLSDPMGALPLASDVIDVVAPAVEDAGDGGGMPWGVGGDGHRFGATATSSQPDAHELGRALKVLLPRTQVRIGPLPAAASPAVAGTVVLVACDPLAAAPLAARAVASGRRCVVLVCSDRLDRLGELATTTAAVLLCWGPLGHRADAVAEALVGRTEPEGRLPIGLSTSPYPLGQGAGYTTFRYSGLRIAPGLVLGRESVRVRCTIANTGPRAGRDVVQVYLENHTGAVAVDGPTLAGFGTVRLAVGQSLAVAVTIPVERLAGWDRSMRHVLSPGPVGVLVGRSIRDIRLSGTLTIAIGGAVRD